MNPTLASPGALAGTGAALARSAGTLATLLALGVLYLSTGTTFLATKIVLHQVAPVPLTMTRLLTAGVLMLPFTVWRLAQTRAWPSRAEVRGAALSALLLLAVGQTALTLGVSVMPAGIAAVIGSSAPLFVAIIAAVTLHQSVSRRQVAGILIGFAGIVALTATSPSGEIVPAGIAALLLFSIAWAIGSLYGRTAALPADPIIALNLQLLLGAAMILSLAIYQSHAEGFPPLHLDTRTYGCFAYLVVMAIASFQAFNWLNRNTSSTVANTFAYVAPVFALILSALFLGETFTLAKALAGSATLAGVALMVR